MFYKKELNMERVFVIKRFENEIDLKAFSGDIYAQEEYCIETLEIPDEKIYGTEMIGDSRLEVILTDLEQNELRDDWYINLTRMCA